MKRVLAILLVMVLALGVFAACDKEEGKNAGTPTPKPTDTPAPTATPTPTPEPTPEPTAEPGSNVALDKPYEVSSETDSTYVQWGWSSEFINDGLIEHEPNSHAGWTSQVKQYMSLDDFEEEWVWFDLKAEYKIDKVVLWPRQDKAENFPMDYYIEVSTDNKNFTKVIEIKDDTRSKDGSMDPATLTFDPVDARYVRVVITKPSDVPSGNDGYLVQFAEIEIFSYKQE